MQEQIQNNESASHIQKLAKLVDSAIDSNQIIVLRADILSQTLENEQSRAAIAIKEDAIQSSGYLLRMAKILDRLND
jgi:hypothetical protein